MIETAKHIHSHIRLVPKIIYRFYVYSRHAHSRCYWDFTQHTARSPHAYKLILYISFFVSPPCASCLVLIQLMGRFHRKMPAKHLLDWAQPMALARLISVVVRAHGGASIYNIQHLHSILYLRGRDDNEMIVHWILVPSHNFTVCTHFAQDSISRILTFCVIQLFFFSVFFFRLSTAINLWIHSSINVRYNSMTKYRETDTMRKCRN